MFDFKKIEPSKTLETVFKLEIILYNSKLTLDEIVARLTREINSPYNKPFSEFLLMLLREGRFNSYEIKNIEINEVH